MAINRERLESRLTELKTQQEQLRANFQAVAGAIADLEFLLQEEDPSPKKGKKD